MKNPRSASALLTVSLLLAGFIWTGGGCIPRPPTGCTSDDDCAEGQVCNVDTGQCEAAPAGCMSDDDCPDGQVCNIDTGECGPAPEGCTSDDDCGEGAFCNIQTGECVPNMNLFATVTFDHDTHMETFDCTTCHHVGVEACDVCHDRDEVVNGVAVLKDVQHAVEQFGCWSCHDEVNPDDTRDCSVCHTALDQQ